MHRHQRGSVLIMALAILTLTAVLGSALITFYTRDADSMIVEKLSWQALLAARSGMEYQLQTLATTEQCQDNTHELDHLEGLAGCRISIRCHTQVISQVLHVQIHSIGQCSSDHHRASRALAADTVLE